MNLEIALAAYIIDFFIGEFPLKHPVQFMGDYIHWFEKKFYKKSNIRGLFLVISLLIIVLIISQLIMIMVSILNPTIQIIILSIISSQGIAHKMLYDSVKKILTSNNPKNDIALLVSRDTESMDKHDINKAAIETYAENLSDGVIAPLFYLLIFGIWGLFIYKAINTLDSMVGYKTERYQKYGFIAAKLDDFANLIPSRLTAILILIARFSLSNFKKIYHQAKLHESPNAGYPITAMAISQNILLGGPTYYHGQLKEKPYFGTGKKEIGSEDLKKTLKIKPHLDIIIIIILLTLTSFQYF